MVSAGMTDATISGGDITFLDDTTGQETLSAGLTISGAGDGVTPNDSPEFDLGIAQRLIPQSGGT